MSRSRSLALLTAAALTAALAPAALASAAVPVSADKADRAKAEHERIIEYWTPERMKAAKPRDFVRHEDGSFTLAPTPKAKPSGSTTTSIAGATWRTADGTGGAVQMRTGKVYFTMDGLGYVCSGSVADDGGAVGASLVLTAGHCVWDAASGFADKWLFIPNFAAAPNLDTKDCANADTVYGCWTATALVAHRGFTTQTTFNLAATQHDFAFAVVRTGGNGGVAELDKSVGGGYPLATTGVTSGEVLSAFGYPAAQKYSGADLTYCSGPIGKDSLNRYDGLDDPWAMSCGMTGGSSGGPWIRALDLKSGSGGTVASLNSYGYTGIKSMFGPVFNHNTLDVWNAAKAIPEGNQVVP
jgi:hypothetical protein